MTSTHFDVRRTKIVPISVSSGIPHVIVNGTVGLRDSMAELNVGPDGVRAFVTTESTL